MYPLKPDSRLHNGVWMRPLGDQGERMTTETNYDSVFGKMAVDQGLCTDNELRHSLQELQERTKITPVMLRELMIELGYITASQAERLKKSIKEDKAAAHKIPGYKILGKIGAGAMAFVYKAKQLSLNRTVAIKVLPRRFSENPEYVQRFYKEGQAAGKLNHPNIVQAIDVGEAGGYHYFVMEYVEGKTIADDLTGGNCFGEKEAIDIIIQVAHALAHAHHHGLVHRDVKPKNIMINTHGVVKLADMGLARETTDIEAAQSEAGKAYGTPYYIAPEQIRGKIDIDGRADIYGLGATFYHMVTGRVPFTGDDGHRTSPLHRRRLRRDHAKTSTGKADPARPYQYLALGRHLRGHRNHDGQAPRGPLQRRRGAPDRPGGPSRGQAPRPCSSSSKRATPSKRGSTSTARS